MQCSEVRELLSPMTDREVSPQELRAIEEHLRACRECAFESTMVVGLKELLRKWEGVRASETFRARVIEKVQNDPAQLPRRSWWVAVAVLAGVGALAAGVAWIELASPEGAAQQLSFPGPSGSGANPAATAAANGGAPASLGGASGPGDLAGRPRAEPVAQLTMTEGAVHIEAPGSPSALGSAGDVLAPAHAVRVSEKGRAELDVLGCLVMRLEGPARYVFGPAFDEGELRSGTAFLRAGRRDLRYRLRSAGARLELQTAGLLASLESLPDGGVRLVVAEGSAEVSSGLASRTLRAGEKLELARDGSARSGPAKAEPSELERLRRWGKR